MNSVLGQALLGQVLLGSGAPAPAGPTVYVRSAADSTSFSAAATALKMAGAGVQPVSWAPQLSIRIDWNNDGSFDLVTEVADDAISIDWHRGGSADLGGADGNSCTIVLDNVTGRYTPRNAGSPLYPNVKVGRRVWVVASLSGLTYPIFAGYVKRIVPLIGMQVQIVCDDPRNHFGDVQVSFSQNRSMKAFRSAILDGVGVSNSMRVLAEESEEIPLTAADTSDAAALLQALNTSNGTREWIKPGTTPATWWQYRTATRHYKLSQVGADITLVEGDVVGVSGLDMSDDSVINYQRVTAQPYYVAEKQEVWSYGTLPVSVPAGFSRTILVGLITEQEVFGRTTKFKPLPVQQGGGFSAWVLDMELAYNVASGTGQVLFTPLGQGAEITINATTAFALDALAINGRPVVQTEALISEDRDATSRADYGAHSGPDIASPFIASEAVALGLAQHLVWRFKQPKLRPAVTMESLFPKMLGGDLFDVVAFPMALFSLPSTRTEITAIDGHATLTPNVDWKVTWQLQETPEQTGALTAFAEFDNSVFDSAAFAY